MKHIIEPRDEWEWPDDDEELVRRSKPGMKLRITYESADGFAYTEITEQGEDENPLTLGSWAYPFPNTESESTAFGLEECITQSDECPPHFFEHPIVKITVEELK